MGFGSIFGSLGRAVKRPFKDIHKAVKGTGGFMNRGFGKMTGGINKTGRALTGRDNKNEMKPSPLVEAAKTMEPSGPPKVKGSMGKKPGEWRGSTYLGSSKPSEPEKRKTKFSSITNKLKARSM